MAHLRNTSHPCRAACKFSAPLAFTTQQAPHTLAAPPAHPVRLTWRAHGARLACRKVAKLAAPAQLRSDVLVGFEPLRQLHADLHARLGHCALFCFDALGGEVVGVKWRPHAWLPQPFQVATAHTHAPSASAAQAGTCVPDAAAVLAEMVEVGSGLVQDVLLCC